MKTQGLYKGKLFSTDILVPVAQIKKIKKTRFIYFQIWLLGGPSPPSQLVPKQLKTVLPCKALGFSYGLITAVTCFFKFLLGVALYPCPTFWLSSWRQASVFVLGLLLICINVSSVSLVLGLGRWWCPAVFGKKQSKKLTPTTKGQDPPLRWVQAVSLLLKPKFQCYYLMTRP